LLRRAGGTGPISIDEDAERAELEGIEQALQVAESGPGLAIGRRPMVDDRLVRGTLVAPFGGGDPTGAAYYLCRPADAAPTAVARRLEHWLRALARAT
jgi:LysR family glycine cleavage system transcriptional activator